MGKTKRKSPIRHQVRQHKRKQRTVRSYYRGHGRQKNPLSKATTKKNITRVVVSTVNDLREVPGAKYIFTWDTSEYPDFFSEAQWERGNDRELEATWLKMKDKLTKLSKTHVIYDAGVGSDTYVIFAVPKKIASRITPDPKGGVGPMSKKAVDDMMDEIYEDVW